MSHLVTDFLINPVLRQARRFSSNNIDRVVDQAAADHAVQDAAVPDEVGPLDDLNDMNIAVPEIDEGIISGRPLVASPMQEDGGLEAELVANGDVGARRGVERSSAIPLRLSSYRSDRMSLDDYDTSNNPSYGVPPRFQTESPMSATLSSTPHTRAASITDIPRPNEGSSQQIAPARPHKQNSSLPEDDGMGWLRKRIIDIRGRDIMEDEKARLIHNLLTEQYTRSLVDQDVKMSTHAMAGVAQQERPVTPASRSSFSFWPGASAHSPPPPTPSKPAETIHLTDYDLEPTYVPVPVDPCAIPDEDDLDVDVAPDLGCKHYKRNVKLQCFICSRWYTCRFCHDEAENHVLPRKETRNMLCMPCGTPQQASDTCANCGLKAARYYCNICKLWDDDLNKSIYHCADCGICRVGRGLGKDYIHCKTCGVCVSIANENSHKCIERASDCDCPICGEYLFSSQESVVFMKCGHSIHRKCHDELMKTTYKCPICSQSVVNMEIQFRALDRAIEVQPMPLQFQDTKAVVSCNDCYAKSMVKYHWLGLKCSVCDSYNTVELQILSGAEAAEAAHADVVNGESSRQTESRLAPEARPSISESAGAARNRRHSSHMGGDGSNFLSSLDYQIPQRLGRSVSPLRRSAFPDHAAAEVSEQNMTDDEDEDDLEFWGGDAPGSPFGPASPRRPADEEEDEEEEEESEDESMRSEDADEDEEDDDPMDLMGHR